MPISEQVSWLFLLAVPIACIAWTVTHEELFREPRDYCVQKSKSAKSMVMRKFFYLFTCEYCFSHYVTIGFLILTGYKLLLMDWRGYLIGGFALVWMANVYMSVFGFIRVGMKETKMEADLDELKLKEVKKKMGI
ncbi:MAG TPA: hypothetical protein VFG10_08145 [Saprospiraceae bacterium]|nr:hypothetical protein [Saprospiraceae bacterium]